MHKIFICYRRAEAEYAAGALSRELRRYFGDEQVFRHAPGKPATAAVEKVGEARVIAQSHDVGSRGLG